MNVRYLLAAFVLAATTFATVQTMASAPPRKGGSSFSEAESVEPDPDDDCVGCQDIPHGAGSTYDEHVAWCYCMAECTHIDSNSTSNPTPEQLRSIRESWMACIGNTNLGYEHPGEEEPVEEPTEEEILEDLAELVSLCSAQAQESNPPDDPNFDAFEYCIAVGACVQQQFPEMQDYINGITAECIMTVAG